MYKYEHTCTRPFPPFYINGTILPQTDSFRGYLQAAIITGDKPGRKTFPTNIYLPDNWSEPTGEDQIKSIPSRPGPLLQKASQSSHGLIQELEGRVKQRSKSKTLRVLIRFLAAVVSYPGKILV